MKKILVPCDFSPPSRAAYRTAMDLALQAGGEVVVVHVSFIPAVYGGFGTETLVFNPDYIESLEKEVKIEFEKMKEEVNVPVPSRMELLYGDVVFSIKNFVETQGMDMIIMGTSGSSGVAEVFIGSNAEKMVRYSPVPVLVVRDYVNVSSLKKIVFPTLLDHDQSGFIKKLEALQKFLGATVHVLLINTPSHFVNDSDAKAAFDKFAKHYKLDNCEYHFRNYRSEEEGIVSFAVSEQMDLIAMATHARKGLAHLFNGSLTEDLVNHIRGPIWTYPLKIK